MTLLTSQTTFTINPAPETITATADIPLLPQNEGLDATPELHYPGDALPPLVYPDLPDKRMNFDTSPLTSRPIWKGELTLNDVQSVIWPGTIKDLPIREIWSGSDTVSRMSLSFFRRLWEYYVNPPATGYITWNPKDRMDKAYNIQIIGLRAGSFSASSGAVLREAAQEIVTLDYPAIINDAVMGEVIFSFIIIGEA